MNWVDVASNQCFSGNTLQNAVTNGYFVLKNSIPANSKMVTKSEAESYVYINSIPSKASNQLVVKSNLTAASLLPYSYTLYLHTIDGNAYVGFDTSGEACAAIFGVTVYSSSSSIGIGTALYYDAYGTETLTASAVGPNCGSLGLYFRIGINFITFQPRVALQCDGYIINSIGTCSVSYTIQWSFSQNANSGNFSISVNGIQVVSVTSTGGGTISISPGDYVETAVGAGASSFLIAQADLLVQDNFITLYNNSTQGYPFAGESFGPYYPSANGNIDATASEF